MAKKIDSHIDLISSVARSLKLQTKRITKGGSFTRGVYITNGSEHLFLAQKQTGFYPTTPRWFSVVADNKIISEQFLKSLGLKTLSSRHIDIEQTGTKKNLTAELKKVTQFPVLVKPERGFKGQGFFIANTATELKRQSNKLFTERQNFLIQKLTFGTEYRVLVVNNTVYAAHTKAFPVVTADGSRTVAALLPDAQYPVDTNFLNSFLKKHKLTLKSIPPAGTEIAYNITRKGTKKFYDTTTVPSAITQWAQDTVKTMGTPTCGFDVFIPDNVADTDNYQIIEINASPGFRYIANKYKRPDITTAICRDILTSHFTTKTTP